MGTSESAKRSWEIRRRNGTSKHTQKTKDKIALSLKKYYK
jgi:hypothetical protein